MISLLEQKLKNEYPDKHKKFLNLYLMKLLDELHAKGYLVVAGYGKHSCYKYSHLDYSDTFLFYRLAREQLFAGARNLFVVCCNNLIALDIDKPHEQEFLDYLLDKYKLNPNQIVKTQNGYHYYFNVNYPVSSQHTSNKQIAIKCNGASMTAPNSIRYDKNYRYIVLQDFIPHTQSGYVQCVKDITKLPFEAYQELTNFNKPERTIPTSKPKKHTTKGNYKNKPVAEYLAGINKDRYLYGTMEDWDYVLTACKMADIGSFNDAYKWSFEGDYANPQSKNFLSYEAFCSRWRWIDPQKQNIKNPYAVLEMLAKG
jgi:hypothetical protein